MSIKITTRSFLKNIMFMYANYIFHILKSSHLEYEMKRERAEIISTLANLIYRELYLIDCWN